MIILGITSVVLGIALLSYNYRTELKLFAYDEMNSKLFTKENKTSDKTDSIEVENQDQSTTEQKAQQASTTKKKQKGVSYSYIGYLEIPKLGIKKGFLDVNDKNNTVEKNIEVVKTSNYPDVENGNLIIAGHSGYGYKAFFKDLYKVENGDVAYVYYGNIKYTYQVKKIYTQERTGKIAIYRNYDQKTLTLITCTKDDKTKQTVYIAELIKQENY